MKASPQINPDTWVDRYGDALYRYAHSRVGSSDVAEDLVQETFLAAVKARDGFKGSSSEKTWLIGILKHKLVDYYRKEKSVIYAQGSEGDWDSVSAFFNAKGGWRILPANWRTNPGKAQEVKDFLDHFYRCLAGLPARTADAFVSREVDGMETREICRKLDISQNNCWVLLYRARMLLRKCLEAFGFDGSPKRMQK
jgi:RNA polymerase sigma-70 factor (ECF subfamily)